MTFNIYTTFFAFAAGYLLCAVPVLLGGYLEYWRREISESRKMLKIPKGGEKVWGGAKVKKNR